MINTGRTRPCFSEACVSIFKMLPASYLGLLSLDGAGEDYFTTIWLTGTEPLFLALKNICD